MDIGIACENRPEELRVVLRPEELRDIAASHSVFVEQGAGIGIGIKDSRYEDVGAKIAEKKEVYACSLVVRFKEPKEEELALIKPGSVVFSMMHLAGNTHLRDLLKKYKITAIAMDEVKSPLGERKIEALHQTGYLGMEKGFELWGGKPSECVVKIMGYGHLAYGAIQCAARKFARIIILNKQNFKNMREHIPETDILVNAINWPMEKRGKEFIITRDMLKLFKEGAIILDLISNPPGQSPIETMHPTTLDNISYSVDNIIHTSCWGWPGLDPVNISRRYSLQVASILKEIADTGMDNLPKYIRLATHK
ncbi:MAG: hypothetical protein KAI43_07365 [Candidatus Aureabacteria bacterium]|nr:hypothetical protein [Candidatus Auribacterota bacterium]